MNAPVDPRREGAIERVDAEVLESSLRMSSRARRPIVRRTPPKASSSRTRESLVRTPPRALVDSAWRELQRETDELRREIARRLHDSSMQKIAAAAMQLSLLERRHRDLGESVAEVQGLLSDCSRELREICHTLRPPMLDLGLGPGLRALENRLGQSRLVLPPEDLPRLDPAAELGAYRVVESALLSLYDQDERVTVDAVHSGRGIVTLTLIGRQRSRKTKNLPAPVLRAIAQAEARGRFRLVGDHLRLDVGFAATSALR